MVSLPAPTQPREAGPEEARHGGHVEGQVESVAEGPRDQAGKEASSREVGGMGGSHLGQDVRPEELLDGVQPEEGGEQAADGRQVGV